MTIMNNLKNSLVYYCGPIDDVVDCGIGWRAKITPWIRGFGIGVLNPCDKPIDAYSETIESRTERHKLKVEGKFQQLHDIMKPIVNYDYFMVDKSTFLICYINSRVHMCGSYHETALAEILKRPVLIVCEDGKDKIPDWMYGMFDYNEFFDSFDELKKYLEYIDKYTDVKSLRRWKFLNHDKIFGKT